MRRVEAANALIEVHKASTQNQKLRTKTSKISMSQRDNRKSCHSDHKSSTSDSSAPTVAQKRHRYPVRAVTVRPPLPVSESPASASRTPVAMSQDSCRDRRTLPRDQCLS